MADIELLGVEEINKKIKQLNAQANRIENKAMKASAKVFHDEIVDRAPRSDEPRQPAKNPRGRKARKRYRTDKWRTGKHAADILKIGNVRRERGGKVIYVGLQKNDTSKAFYLKFHEWGTTKMRARPFMEPAVQEKQQEALEALRSELKKGLGLS